MKKLSLDQLEVENFASQPSEEELTNVKGGGTPVAVAAYAAGAAIVGAVVYAGTEIYKAYEDDNDIPATRVNLQYKRFDPSIGDTVNVDSTYYVR